MLHDHKIRKGQLAGRLLLVWALLALVTLAINFDRLLTLDIRGDDALRLVQLRDLLAGQGWFDLTQYRIDPPGGVVTHWSRLVDLPIALVLLALVPLLGQPLAETVVLVAIPLLTLAAAIGFVGAAAARLFDLRTAGIAALTIGLLTPVLFQLQPTRIDHHGWQIAAAAAAVLGIAMRNTRGAWLAGAAMAVGATISLEVVPLTAVFAAFYVLRWIEDADQRWELVAYMQGLALGLVLLFAVALGPNFAQYCDAIGPAHLAFFAFAALATRVVAKFEHLSPVMLLTLLATAAAGASVVFAGLAPQCLQMPFGSLDPLVREYWYLLIMEGRPAWEQAPATALPPLVQVGLALVGTGLLANRGPQHSRRFWQKYAVLLAGSIALGLLTWRSMGFAGIVATLPLGWLMAHALGRIERIARLPVKLLASLCLALAFMPSILFIAAERLGPAGQAPAAPTSQTLLESDCARASEVSRLRALPRGEIVALFDFAPAILLHTGHAVTATGHHRAEAAMADTIAIYLSEPAQAQRLARQRGADYIAICPGMSEAQVYARANPAGLAARLIAGDIPGWLAPLPGFAEGDLRVWRIRRE